ncbi:MAG TPA: matrixin family metalloprotease [Gemmatimonadaceae bacterium]|nr:matrixin family metalloprotease [Gemmatimonadaceae bacterium]
MRRAELFLVSVAATMLLFVGGAVIGGQRPGARARPSKPKPLLASGAVVDSLERLPLRSYKRIADLPRDTMQMLRMIRDDRDAYYREYTRGAPTVFRWPTHQRQVIRVWIDRAPAVDPWNPNFADIVEGAFGEWTAAGFPMRFDFLPDSASADLHVRWIRNFAEEGVLGSAERALHGYWITGGLVTIATRDFNGMAMTPAMIHSTARHEIGHALGLDHVPDPESIMFPLSVAVTITPRDRATMNLLYALPPGRLPTP